MIHANAHTHVGCIGSDCPHCPKLDMPGNEAMRAHLTSRPPGSQRVCLHRGEPTGEAVACLEGCGAGWRLKVLECAVHGACTVEKHGEGVAACCRDCPDFKSRPVLQVQSKSAGIGDHLMTLQIAEGLRRQFPGSSIVYVAESWVHQWLDLFEVGRLATVPLAAPLCFADHSGDWARFTAAGKPRWQWWQEQFGTAAAIPQARPIPADVLESVIQFAGCVVLAPFAAYPERTWPVERWIEVERLLMAAGHRVIIIDDRPDRTSGFASTRLIREPAQRVAAVMATGVCVAGNDSGMVHVAGILRLPAVAVCSPASDQNIFGCYPTVVSLGGQVTWDGFENSPTKGVGLDAVTPAQVVSAVLAQVRASLGDFPAERFASIVAERDRWRLEAWLPVYAALWRTVRELQPRRIVEIGTRAGYSAWTMLEALPKAVVHSIDLDSDEHGGYRGAHAHAREILSRSERATLQLADSHALNAFELQACDLVYIDGDHSDRGATLDLELAERSGAPTVLVDDYTNCTEVRHAVDRFIASRPHLRGRFIASATGLYLISANMEDET